MTSNENDRYHLLWEPGLCRHGCARPVSRGGNQFINGHGAKLLDILVDAHREGVPVTVTRGLLPAEVAPRSWAVESFTPRGVAWFDWLVSHHDGERPTPAQIDEVLAAMPDSSVEELLTEPLDAPVVLPPQIIDARPPEKLLESDLAASFDSSGLLEDLETVREVVGLAQQAESPEDLDRLQELVDQTVAELASARSRIAELEAELAVAQRPLVFDQAAVKDMPDRTARRVAEARVKAAAKILDMHRYRGDGSEVWDLIPIVSSTDPVRTAAARALLGEDEG